MAQSSYFLAPDVAYTYHTPHPPEGMPKNHGVIRVNMDIERVVIETTTGEDNDQLELEKLDFMHWEEAIRAKGIVITPLIQRAGAAVKVSIPEDGTQTEKVCIGCLVPPMQNDEELLDGTDLTYHALLTSDMRTARIFFLETLTDCLLPVGEILYLDMTILENPAFREQGRGDKLLFTRLDIPHIRTPEVGKLYVTCLHQPKGPRGRSARGASSLTFTVNPWDVQLASLFEGDPSRVVRHLH